MFLLTRATTASLFNLNADSCPGLDEAATQKAREPICPPVYFSTPRKLSAKSSSDGRDSSGGRRINSNDFLSIFFFFASAPRSLLLLLVMLPATCVVPVARHEALFGCRRANTRSCFDGHVFFPLCVFFISKQLADSKSI